MCKEKFRGTNDAPNRLLTPPDQQTKSMALHLSLEHHP